MKHAPTWMFPIKGQIISVVFSHKSPTRKDLTTLKQFLDLASSQLKKRIIRIWNMPLSKIDNQAHLDNIRQEK